MFSTIRSRLILIAVLIVASVYFLFPRKVTIREPGPNGVMHDVEMTRVPLKRGLDLQGVMLLGLELEQS
jgi:preprotein translocase subunit SecD